MIIYKRTEEFDRDIKKLIKKFPTLEEDVEVAKSFAIELYHLKNIDRRAIFPMPDFCSDDVKICKLKKFACRSLKGRGIKSGIRIIYAFYPTKMTIEFIEIYFKSDKEKEDFERIKEYLKNNKL